LGYNSQAIKNVRIATIGPATAAALTHYGITAELIPNEYVAESIAEALIESAQQHGESLQGKRILLARAAEARKVLVTQLQEAGAIVDEIAAYRTFPIDNNDEQGRAVLRLLQSAQLDILTFTSSSTVRNFVHWLKDCEEQRNNFSAEAILRNPQLTIACIGPITSQTARKLGLNVSIEAQEFTIAGLVEAILFHEERT
jgi:uroporphyrinogen-III synthase